MGFYDAGFIEEAQGLTDRNPADPGHLNQFFFTWQQVAFFVYPLHNHVLYLLNHLLVQFGPVYYLKHAVTSTPIK